MNNKFYDDDRQLIMIRIDGDRIQLAIHNGVVDEVDGKTVVVMNLTPRGALAIAGDMLNLLCVMEEID